MRADYIQITDCCVKDRRWIDYYFCHPTKAWLREAPDSSMNQTGQIWRQLVNIIFIHDPNWRQLSCIRLIMAMTITVVKLKASMTITGVCLVVHILIKQAALARALCVYGSTLIGMRYQGLNLYLSNVTWCYPERKVNENEVHA